MPSAWKNHVKRWVDCEACDLCEGRRKVVLARGNLPCDFLFIGEAPGESEDDLGQPFVGPAGKLLDKIINRAGFDLIDHDIEPVRRAFSNLVCCIPKDDNNRKIKEPPEYAIEACSERLEGMIRLAKPKVIVALGKLSQKELPRLLERMYGAPKRSARKTTSVSGGHRKAARHAKRRVVVEEASNHSEVQRPVIVNIIHPAAIIRADISEQKTLMQNAIVTLAEALSDLIERDTNET